MVDSQATFALLQPPSFDVLPNTDVQLGSIHPRTQARPRRPDTKRILNRSKRVPVPPELFRTRLDPEVVLDSETLRSHGGGFRLNLPILQGVGGGINGESSDEKLLCIVARNVETQWFLPDDSYFAQAIKGSTVKRELLHFRRPSVFMVTGVKIAESATIVTGSRKTKEGEIGPEVDLTAFGIPIEVGASVNASRGDFRIVPIQKSCFVLAFETRRIRVKEGGLAEGDFTGFAMLYDDDKPQRKILSEHLREKLSLDEVTTEVDNE